MVKEISLKNDDLDKIAQRVAQSLSYATTFGTTSYINTAVTYPNGTSVVVRIDIDKNDFFVSDDGQGSLCAELFGGNHQFNRIAPDIAKKYSLSFDKRSFFLMKASVEQLPAAVAYIANASAFAVERTLQLLDKQRDKASRALFNEKIIEAFGKKAEFDIDVLGASKKWKIDAAVYFDNNISSIFEFVTPAPASIAFAHMKIGDISAINKRPKTTIVLSDYDKTDPQMRNVLSTSTDYIIAANANISEYRNIA